MDLRGVSDERDSSDPYYEPLLDMSAEEWRLGEVIPSQWTDEGGIKHIVVHDDGVELRYLWENNELKILRAEIF